MFQVVSNTNNVVVKLRDQLLMMIWADLIAFFTGNKEGVDWSAVMDLNVIKKLRVDFVVTTNTT